MTILKIVAIMPVILLELVAASIEIVTTTISGLLAILRVWLFREYDYRNWLKRDLADCDSILEIGCGHHSPLLYIGYGGKSDAVDIWSPYIEMHTDHGNYRKCWQADICNMDWPGENSYDAVVIFDVMEHLPRETVESMDLWKLMERCARKKVICFTPNGFIENDEVDGDPWQAHVSSWEPVDYLKRGYNVAGATGLRWLFGKASLPKYHPYSIVAIVGMLSKVVVFHKPEWAWHSYAVKEV